MTENEHTKWLNHVFAVTKRACLECTTDDLMVMPHHIWAGGKCKAPEVVRARTLIAIELQRTVGRKASEPRTTKERRTKAPERPWRIYPEGFPADGEYEPMSTPLLAEWCGGGCHSTFVRIFERERARLAKGQKATSQAEVPSCTGTFLD